MKLSNDIQIVSPIERCGLFLDVPVSLPIDLASYVIFMGCLNPTKRLFTLQAPNKQPEKPTEKPPYPNHGGFMQLVFLGSQKTWRFRNRFMDSSWGTVDQNHDRTSNVCFFKRISTMGVNQHGTTIWGMSLFLFQVS